MYYSKGYGFMNINTIQVQNNRTFTFHILEQIGWKFIPMFKTLQVYVLNEWEFLIWNCH